jgi:hypothetical protein
VVDPSNRQLNRVKVNGNMNKQGQQDMLVVGSDESQKGTFLAPYSPLYSLNVTQRFCDNSSVGILLPGAFFYPFTLFSVPTFRKQLVNFSNTTGHITIKHVWFNNRNRCVGAMCFMLSFGTHANNGQIVGDNSE